MHDVDVGRTTRRRRRCRFALGVTETSGREVFTIALTAQINIDPARRELRRRARASASSTSSASPSAGRRPRTASCGRTRRTLVPSFTGADARSRCPCRARYDLELAAAKYFYSLPDGEVPLALPLHAARSCTAATTGSCRSCSSRGRARRTWRMPVATWREMMERHYPDGALGRACTTTRRAAARAGPPRARAAVLRRLRRRLLERRRRPMHEPPALEELARHAALRGLRALPVHAAARPRTPRRRRSASSTRRPTRADAGSTFDQLRMHGRRARRRRRACSTAEVRFLQAQRRPSAPGAERRVRRRPAAARRARGRAARAALRARRRCTAACGCRPTTLGDGAGA